MKTPQKISFRLVVAVGLTAILCIGAYALVIVNSMARDLESEVERHANQLSETVKYGTREDMLHNQRDRIHRLIQNMASQPGIHRIRVLNKSGEIVYSSHEGDIGKMLDKKAEACYACHAADQPLQRLSIEDRTRTYRPGDDSPRILGIINPIYNEQSCWTSSCHEHGEDQSVLGVLDVTMSLEEIDNRITASTFKTIIFAVGTIVGMSLIIGLALRQLVDRPVRKLVNATQEVASGNLQHKIEVVRDDELGALARSFNNMTDKLSEAKMQLFQSDKMASLGRLAAGVAHEINNPLTGVLTYSSFLLKRTQEHPDIQDDLRVIVRETLRSREIVKSLLDFARQSVPKRNAVDIHEVIGSALQVVENQLSIHHVRVERFFDMDVPPIQVDTNQMQQVFINLLVNAADAMGEEGGSITIRTSRLSLAALGTLLIKKATCPKRHNLIDQEVKIQGHPSVKLRITSHGSEGTLHFDPLYGSHRHEPTIVLNHSVPEISCPQCRTSLMEPEKKCPTCGAPVFAFDTPSKGRFESCARPGCEWQRWQVADDEGHKEFVNITVTDTGCGIPSKDVPRIFEPFYTTKGQKGTGLGLSVIWGILDNHNGRIQVDSKEGEGTTFTIQLPVE